MQQFIPHNQTQLSSGGLIPTKEQLIEELQGPHPFTQYLQDAEKNAHKVQIAGGFQDRDKTLQNTVVFAGGQLRPVDMPIELIQEKEQRRQDQLTLLRNQEIERRKRLKNKKFHYPDNDDVKQGRGIENFGSMGTSIQIAAHLDPYFRESKGLAPYGKPKAKEGAVEYEIVQEFFIPPDEEQRAKKLENEKRPITPEGYVNPNPDPGMLAEMKKLNVEKVRAQRLAEELKEQLREANKKIGFYQCQNEELVKKMKEME